LQPGSPTTLSRRHAAIAGKWLADPTKRSAVPILLRIPNYFEDLAIMVEEGHLDLEFVAKGFSALALWEWDYWKEAISLMRVELEDEQTYVGSKSS
jgi:hypothetical protein